MNSMTVATDTPDLRTARPLHLAAHAIRKATAEEMAMMQHIRELAIAPEYTHTEGPADTVYAEVKRNGKTIATLYNSGTLESPNAVAAQIRDLPSVRDSQQSGPALAQARAEEIAALLGGSVEKSATAQTQTAWQASPKQQYVTDWEALRRDPRIADYYRVDSGALLLAQSHIIPVGG